MDLSRTKKHGGLTIGLRILGVPPFLSKYIRSFILDRDQRFSSVEAEVPADCRVPAGETPACTGALHRDWRFYRWVRVVTDEFEIFECEIVDVP